MNLFTKSLALLGCFAGLCSLASAQDSGALLDALVKKGILTDQEAEDIRVDLSRDYAMTNINAAPGSRNVSKLAITGRVQAQYNLVDNDADNAVAAATNSRFSLRRVRLGATADFGPAFRGVISYDMVANNLDVGYIRWNQSPDLSIDAGFRKVNFGYEENTSSSRLPAIERSPVTRFFVESNNGRRLGAGSRRTGVFADGKSGDFFYGAAVTNLEREANPNTAQTGDASQPALWANGGFKGKSENTSHTVGASFGYLPEQITSGTGSIYGTGLNSGALLVASLYGDVTVGNLGVTGELLWSDNDAGVGANSWGFHVIPTYNLSEQLQLVARLAYLDTDGIATRPGDVVPGAGNPVGNPGFETVTEIYGGINYFFKGNDVKFSAGLFYANFEDQIGGAGNVEAQSVGLRSQMQVNF
jgi:hypothetical protein